jgi:predicted transcriptional regulator
MIDIESLRKLRREVGLTQAEVSIEVGVSQAYIARLENGTLDPKLSIVNKIMDVLNRRRKTKCSEIMTSNPVTIDARDSASIAVGLMQKHSYSQLPVLRAQQIVGIITERDIIRNLQHDMQTLSVQAVMSSECVPIVD